MTRNVWATSQKEPWPAILARRKLEEVATPGLQLQYGFVALARGSWAPSPKDIDETKKAGLISEAGC
jgi:hypothetical protein